ncbi:unnamed protein product [Prorocentrum cordatum]|uniref:Methyltransferase type 11 domain-containing protein n=1 Tax=Prorocentrum cordatum TaxID=2364126 RepID=A0ABN9VM15_9DINO|nr:unnamed protein product [Polarella glacialis]
MPSRKAAGILGSLHALREASCCALGPGSGSFSRRAPGPPSPSRRPLSPPPPLSVGRSQAWIKGAWISDGSRVHGKSRSPAAERGGIGRILGRAPPPIHGFGDRAPSPWIANPCFRAPDPGARCREVLCSVEDPAAALRETSRVLVPGGRFGYLEHVSADVGSPLEWQQLAMDPLQQQIAGNCHLHRDTEALIRGSVGSEQGSLFSQLDDTERYEVWQMWPISQQVVGVATK